MARIITILLLLSALLPLGLSPDVSRPAQAQGSAPLTLAWSAREEERSYSLAWGDVDGDGDLDLAVGNDGSANRLYRNDGGALNLTPIWSSSEADRTHSLAWGDVDGDGDLDLAVGNDGVNRLYRNNGGALSASAAWSSSEADSTRSIAWGDVDGDGDLDLAAGNNGVSRIYHNAGSALSASAGWSSEEPADTWSVAWADVDGDGDLDLAVGNDGADQLYTNEGGALEPTPGWSSLVDEKWTTSLAWGDIDNDGDPDLVAGAWLAPKVLYRNDEGSLGIIPVWLSDELDDTRSMALGDIDGDGDLDLAVGNEFEPTRVYFNTGDTLSSTAGWSDSTDDQTLGLAWGDVDNDGDLDLASASLGNPNRVYRNNGNTLAPQAGWSSANSGQFFAVAWGDLGGDRNLDLAVGSVRNLPVSLYQSQGPAPSPTAAWQSSERDYTRSLAWGDADNDGDLDLAVGNQGQPNRLYRNDGGTLTSAAVWSSSEADWTRGAAWGDVDGDGDLDLAVANQQEPNRLYRNDGGTLTSAAVWSSSEVDFSAGLAWGDVDGDGDLDLAVANRQQPNRLYRNDSGTLTSAAVWSSPDTANSLSVAWGDVDGDGDLDLAFGNYNTAKQLYRNDNGLLTSEAIWRSTESEPTSSVAFGDMDGDGDLDLVTGTMGRLQPNRIYRNEGGQLNPTAAWSAATFRRDNGTEDLDDTWGIALGDADSDGDLDLAIASYDNPNRIFFNTRNDAGSRVRISDPYAGADFYGTGRILRQRQLSITYTLSHPEGRAVRFIRVFYSPNGGGRWLPAMPAPGTVTRDLTAAPGGSAHTFTWDAAADLIKSDNLVVRIEAYDGLSGPGPFQRSFSATQSFPFRLETAEWYAQIVDEQGRPVAGAQVIADGALVVDAEGSPLTSDRAGLVRLDGVRANQQLVAISAPVESRPSSRAQHDGWAYRVHTTSLRWGDDGQPQAFTTATPGRQRLTLRADSPLVLFNLVVSLEWAATEAERAQFERAFREASAYLYDISDGQMAFGKVLIADNARHWADADIQFLTNNHTHPHAYVSGITATDTSHVIRLGRAWDGNSGSQGSWDAPDGHRTIVHEFGHYALGLYDSYLGYRFGPGGVLLGRINAACTGYDKVDGADDPVNATIMDHQYTSSELAMRGVAGLWADSCEATAQWQLNGESDWETVLRIYRDQQAPARWRFVTPLDRRGPLAGPGWPAQLLPQWPDIQRSWSGLGVPARRLTVLDTAGRPQRGVIVALYRQGGGVISQGLTDAEGRLEIYDARAGDTVRVATMDGGYHGSLLLGAAAEFQIRLRPVGQAAQLTAAGGIPHLRVIPFASPDPAQVALTVQLLGFAPGGDPQILMTTPDAVAHTPALSYSAPSSAYEGTISVSAGTQGTGRIQAVGAGGGGIVNRQTTYRLQLVTSAAAHEIFSDDGRLWLQLPPGSLPGERAYLAVMPPGALPGPLPADRAIVGEPFDLTASGALVQLERQALLQLRYDATQLTPAAADGLQIARWDPAQGRWQALPSTVDGYRQTVTAPMQLLGIYALLGPAQSGGPDRPTIWLPLLSRRS